MNKVFYVISMKSVMTLLLVGFLTSGLCAACSKDDDDKEQQQEELLYYRYWPKYPQSYIKMCDWRFTFRLTKVQRNGSSLMVDYVLNNTGFDQTIEVWFSMPENGAAHDDMGNSYRCESTAVSPVVSTIDGKMVYPVPGTLVKFLPNQAIKGTLQIRDFDTNAMAFSVTINIKPNTSGITLNQNRIDFVNIPLDANDGDGSYQNI